MRNCNTNIHFSINIVKLSVYIHIITQVYESVFTQAKDPDLVYRNLYYKIQKKKKLQILLLSANKRFICRRLGR